MRTRTYDWNIREQGQKVPCSYYGCKTKKEAVAFAQEWNKKHDLKVEVVKYNRKERWWEEVNF